MARIKFPIGYYKYGKKVVTGCPRYVYCLNLHPFFLRKVPYVLLLLLFLFTPLTFELACILIPTSYVRISASERFGTPRTLFSRRRYACMYLLPTRKVKVCETLGGALGTSFFSSFLSCRPQLQLLLFG
jgi:hypothetical protein